LSVNKALWPLENLLPLFRRMWGCSEAAKLFASARFVQRMRDFFLGNLCFFQKKAYTNQNFFAILNLNCARLNDALFRVFFMVDFWGFPV